MFKYLTTMTQENRVHKLIHEFHELNTNYTNLSTDYFGFWILDLFSPRIITIIVYYL